MTASIRRLSLTVTGLLAIGLVLAGLSVEAISRTKVTRAQRALTGALARTLRSGDLQDETRALIVRARSRAARGAWKQSAATLAERTGETPTQELHGLAALAHLAADEGQAAARHAQLAARLAPTDKALAIEADRMVDLALLYRFRPATRVAGGIAAVFLLGLALWLTGVRRDRRRMEKFLDSVSGRVRFAVDGEPATSQGLRLAQDTESLTFDVFLNGRYGMACPRRPRRAPTLHLTCSHAGSNQTLRLRPVRGVTGSAVRIPMRRETLRRLLGQKGRWRVHVRLGTRMVATGSLDVLARRSLSAPISLRNGALTI